MGYLLLSMLLIVIGATVASGWVVHFILSAAGVGRVWRTGDIYETSAIIAIYTMIFISILSLVILSKDQLKQKMSWP